MFICVIVVGELVVYCYDDIDIGDEFFEKVSYLLFFDLLLLSRWYLIGLKVIL